MITSRFALTRAHTEASRVEARSLVRHLSTGLCLATPLLLAACSSPTAEVQATAVPTEAAQPAGGELPAGHPPIDPSRDPSLLAIPGHESLAAQSGAGLAFDLPSGWQAEPPSSSMRISQASIPGEAGAASLAVFFFGAGGGGGVQANLDRWVAQIQATDGSGAPQSSQMTVGDLTVHRIEVRGTLLPSTMGAGPTEPEPGSVLWGAVVEGAGGPWFLKLTGPEATLAPRHAEWEALLRSLHLAG